ncbi:MAG: hypothetical protein AVDCRST_MAG56-7921 [uncultured Cytophagales bacterium]|uniref:DoxX family protein n=1 Tax=uncultured Cytophagales bacterium TaxID=158755 RepID=A0A6J4LUI8_9SPHI|nr:MAG: hypothetical protein AVDCRST_MAG56-7921 [uncultured Cytophagales bacterium]
MKKIKITYWLTTALLALFMAFSAYGYLTQAEMKAAFGHLGFPDYFRAELAVAKLLGAVALLAPVGPRVKEWAYAGFAIPFVSAFVAHAASGDPVTNRAWPVAFLGLLAVSYLAYHKLQAGRPQSVPAPRAEVAVGA